MLYSRYGGSLYVTLSSGLRVTIPNDQLVTPDYTIAEDGATTFSDNTRVVKIRALQSDNAEDMPILGVPFLTAAYLLVNQDTSTFTIWQSNATSETELVAIDSTSSTAESTSTCDATGNAAPADSAPTAAPTDRPDFRENRLRDANGSLSGGTIAGIVVGLVAALGLTVAVLVSLREKGVIDMPCLATSITMRRDSQARTGNGLEDDERVRLSTAKVYPPDYGPYELHDVTSRAPSYARNPPPYELP